jgi:hypothetical protein
VTSIGQRNPSHSIFVTTFDAVHDQGQPLNLLKGIHCALRSGGVYLMQDIRGSSFVHKNVHHPVGTFLYTASCLHCMTVSLAQGGEGLGAMWGEERLANISSARGSDRSRRTSSLTTSRTTGMS